MWLRPDIMSLSYSAHGLFPKTDLNIQGSFKWHDIKFDIFNLTGSIAWDMFMKSKTSYDDISIIVEYWENAVCCNSYSAEDCWNSFTV